MTRYTIAALAVAFLALLTVAAFAQPAPVLVQPNDTGGWNFTPFLDELAKFASSAFVLVLTGAIALALKPLNKYFGTHIEAQEVVKDLKMHDYVTVAVGKAYAYAKQQTGLGDEQMKDVQIRNPMLQLAAGFLFKQYPEVWTYIANTEKGVMQYIEAELPSGAALPANNVAGVGPVPLLHEVKP